MRIGSLFFIVIVTSIVLFGLILGSGMQNTVSPTKQTDSFGNSTSNVTNTTSGIISNVTTFETQGFSAGLLILGVLVIILVVFGAMVMMRKSGLGGNRYRT